MRKNSVEEAGFGSRPLYGPSLVKRASSLQLSTRALSESLRSGSFRSMYKGRGIEFSGVREYFPQMMFVLLIGTLPPAWAAPL